MLSRGAGRLFGEAAGSLPAEEFGDPVGDGQAHPEAPHDVVALVAVSGVMQPFVEFGVEAFARHEFECGVLQTFFFVITGLDVGD